MSMSTQPLALTADEVRHAINQWSQEGLFRIRGLGDRISVKAIIGHSCYTLRLKSQYESRCVSAAQVPYEGGSVDSGGVPPDAWDMPVRRPADFQERQEKMTVPHTEQIVICSMCAGTGVVSCTSCQGSGKTNCTWCHGRGWQERMQPGSTHMVREDCKQCVKGKVNCTSCNGRGQKVCGSCTGRCRVKSYKELTVEFNVAAAEEALTKANVLGSRTINAKGQIVFKQRFTSGEKLTGIPSEVDTRVTELLRQAQAAGGSDKRVLFQHLEVEEVPMCEVVYEYRRSPERRLWIYGQQRFVYAPEAPRPWGKIALVCGGLLLVAVGAAWTVWAVMVPK